MGSHLKKRHRMRTAHRARAKKRRPRSFKTEQAAQEYAKAKGYKKFSVRNLRLDPRVAPKFQIVVEE